jgi:hypothetical protein
MKKKKNIKIVFKSNDYNNESYGFNTFVRDRRRVIQAGPRDLLDLELSLVRARRLHKWLGKAIKHLENL